MNNDIRDTENVYEINHEDAASERDSRNHNAYLTIRTGYKWSRWKGFQRNLHLRRKASYFDQKKFFSCRWCSGPQRTSSTNWGRPEDAGSPRKKPFPVVEERQYIATKVKLQQNFTDYLICSQIVSWEPKIKTERKWRMLMPAIFCEICLMSFSRIHDSTG